MQLGDIRILFCEGEKLSKDEAASFSQIGTCSAPLTHLTERMSGVCADQNDDMMLPDDLLETQNVLVNVVGTTVVKGASAKDIKLTSRAQDRLDRLLKWVDDETFVLRVDLFRSFQVILICWYSSLGVPS